MKRRFRRTILGVFSFGTLLMFTLGMRFPGAPGDCITEDSGWASTDGGCRDQAAGGLVWGLSSKLATGLYRTWGSAKTYCDSLDEGGSTDWRLPTKSEMLDAVARGGATHLAIINANIAYWSSTTKGNGQKFAWMVQFNGSSNWYSVGSGFDATCVRTP